MNAGMDEVDRMDRVDELREETQRLACVYERKLAALEELKKSLLQPAFRENYEPTTDS